MILIITYHIYCHPTTPKNTVFSLLKPWVVFKKNFFGVGIIKGKGLFKGGIIF